MLAFAVASTRAISEDAASFQSFLDELRRDAAARAIKRTTFEAAFAGVTPNSAVLAAMRRQPEYGKPFGSYLASLVSPVRIEGGLRTSSRWKTPCAAVEEKFGVDKSILVSIWGIDFVLRRERRSLGRVSVAGDAGPCRLPASVLSRRVAQRAQDAPGSPRAAPAVRRLLGWRHGAGTEYLRRAISPMPVDFDGDGYARHLAQRARRTRLDRQLPAEIRLAAGPALGLRGRGAAKV